ncbi:hypothetical protein A7J50_2559 [Pseudomonas antarctica]|uniref:Uncharacterized protein n=1 Tax=Pseudomonas antarctica TaxID=219572 RepID=A0A172Z0X3_9PSED|nr:MULTISPECIES: hypothetical protein [Pseudomonas]ANF85958.1 hypothetical protein A7J50_2559 [Pseudomonas antarctica]UXV22190.1 hypothetical protein N4P55_12790 [Pseudomonas fluorescens]
MKWTSLVLLLGNSMFVCAESKLYNLSPVFNEVDVAEFLSASGARGQTISGYLTGKSGVRYTIPDVCEPEGGDAELTDAYTVKGKRSYFLFTCAWPVQHSGIGLSGVQYETFIYIEKNLASVGKEKELSRILSGYEGKLSEGSSNYAWYVSRKIASEKILELERGRSVDFLKLAQLIVLSRLNDGG